jgi:cytidylate kinase
MYIVEKDYKEEVQRIFRNCYEIHVMHFGRVDLIIETNTLDRPAEKSLIQSK